ncbi:response regulator [Chryseobacterium indologenes]|uniref:response regulator n=1 Tax=Chryseobacterium TaxID=59732 RepID=UPI00048A3DB4|nr:MULTISPECIES: response regulator [Chryseobacterium]ASE64023.1 response regulator [Chryseobacterium indologenes]AYZ37061.1 response regulator [Chryseobacterium indologenes]MBF6645903.1 response regulator [Chryseobacterium indologenes]MEB4760948.1 response regulator [Chryseobacterium indologenes]QQQ70434.1 response regulator [Chryseobacterium indologenes]
MNKEFLNVIVADSDENTLTFFKNIFKEQKISIKIQSFNNGKNMMKYLNHEDAVVPEIVFIQYAIPEIDSMECIAEFKSHSKFNNMVTVIFSDQISEHEIEDIFVAGTNIYMRKPEDFKSLKKVLSDIISINWQYHTSGLNKDHFILKI